MLGDHVCCNYEADTFIQNTLFKVVQGEVPHVVNIVNGHRGSNLLV